MNAKRFFRLQRRRGFFPERHHLDEVFSNSYSSVPLMQPRFWTVGHIRIPEKAVITLVNGAHRKIGYVGGLLILSLSIYLSGCIKLTLTLVPYELKPFDQYTHSEIKDGVAVAIQPVIDKDDAKQYFGRDLLSEHVLAVFVIVENRAPSSSYILWKDRVSLIAGYMERREPSSAEVVAGPGAVGEGLNVLFGLIPYGSPLKIISMKLISDHEEVKYNLAVTELHTRTISPGNRVFGVVYFELPEKIEPGIWVVRVEVTNPETKEYKLFDIPFKWDLK